MKKALTLIISIIMVLSLGAVFQTSIFATSSDYTVEILGPSSIIHGQNVEYTISVTNINSERGGLLGADIDLSFDTDVFSYGTVTVLNMPDGWASSSVNETQVSNGIIILAPVYESGTMIGIITDNSIKYKISFTVKKADIASTSLSFTRLEGAGADYNAYYGSSTGLDITLSEETTAVPDKKRSCRSMISGSVVGPIVITSLVVLKRKKKII